ncbi:Natural killer cell receptor 2B4 [Galemys pyrenaicus]|uniref:Natural killer cell receptor 2B4 n=1 Tax=Galemys pyrenaicus TaxID=202257 RepID=A0A8J5ZUY8_GALPY|nr:Natural killer cell receptor 2B4 [Galemys pyrenaicus]
MLTWRNKSDPRYEDCTSPLFGNRLDFSVQDFALHVKEAQQRDSGLYRFELTQNTGAVEEICFQVSISEHVEKPQLQGRAEILEGGMCQVSLNCSVSRADGVSFAWHRGNEQIQGWRSRTQQEQVAANSLLVYTCSINNTVSWENSTLDLTGDCQKTDVLILISTVVPAVLLVTLLVATICFCVRKQKMKQPVFSPATTRERKNGVFSSAVRPEAEGDLGATNKALNEGLWPDELSVSHTGKADSSCPGRGPFGLVLGVGCGYCTHLLVPHLTLYPRAVWSGRPLLGVDKCGQTTACGQLQEWKPGK